MAETEHPGALDRHPRGLDRRGYIEREGALGRIPHAFRPVATARYRLLDTFGTRLHSARTSTARSPAAPRAWDAATSTSSS